MIDDVTHTSSTPPPAKATATTDTFGGLDKDAFLQLLVAQLRYQNPMAPKDGQEYLAQAAQFATVERLDNIAKAQTEAVAFQQVLLSTSMVGKQVSGTPAENEPKIIGRVDAVVFDAGVPHLIVGGRALPLGLVDAVTS